MIVEHTADGDNHLSANDIKFWQLTWHCMRQFGCPVLHKVRGPNARMRESKHIRFFVPANHPQCAETVAFLIQELTPMLSPEQKQTETEDWFWGTYITVSEYNGNGSEFYLDHGTLDQLVRKTYEDLCRYVQERKAREE
jgi:hypothetical protein